MLVLVNVIWCVCMCTVFVPQRPRSRDAPWQSGFSGRPKNCHHCYPDTINLAQRIDSGVECRVSCGQCEQSREWAGFLWLAQWIRYGVAADRRECEIRGQESLDTTPRRGQPKRMEKSKTFLPILATWSVVKHLSLKTRCSTGLIRLIDILVQI